MAIAVHLVNTPKSDVREAYAAAWDRLDETGNRHPAGRRSHTAWLDGDVLHVLDVWDSEDDLTKFLDSTLGAILEETGMRLAGPPAVGEFLQTVTAGD